MYEFKLPDLGEGVHEGEILHWHVKAGDTITEDDPLVEVETDKAAVTIPSPKAGKVVSVAGGIGDTVAVGSVLVVIDDGGNGAGAAVASTPVAPSAPAPAEAPKASPRIDRVPTITGASEETPPPSAVANASARVGPIPAAPATRRLARELGIELGDVVPTGPGGRVTSEDVRRHGRKSGVYPAIGSAQLGESVGPASTAAPAAVPRPPAAVQSSATSAPQLPSESAGIPFLNVEPLPDFAEQGPVDVEALRSIRRKVAHKMVTSMSVVPHVAHMDEADVNVEIQEAIIKRGR